MMIRTMIQLTEEQLEALKALAKKRKTSVAKLVRESVAQYMTTSASEATREKKRRRALEALEMIEKAGFRDVEGKTDVARNHDKYLEELYGS